MSIFDAIYDDWHGVHKTNKHWHRNDFITHLMHEATGGPQQGASGDYMIAQTSWQHNFTNQQVQKVVDALRVTSGAANGAKAFIGGTIGTTITPGVPANPVYIPITGGTFSFTTESQMQLAVPFNGILRNLFIQVYSLAPDAATSFTFTVNKNGVATPIVATLLPAAVPPVTISDTTHSAAVIQGDLIDVVLQKHGGGAGAYTIGISCLGIEIDPT